jgi:hypothetical protein
VLREANSLLMKVGVIMMSLAFALVIAAVVVSVTLERQSSSHAAVAFRSSAGIVRAITCRLCTTAERLRSKRFLRTPL